MHNQKNRALLVFSAALIFCSATGAASAASVAPHSAPAVAPTAELAVVTPAQLQELRAEQKSGESNIFGRLGIKQFSANPLNTTPPGGTNWYAVSALYKDGQDRTVPIRQGFDDGQAPGGNGGGFQHACFDHNMCNLYPLEVAIEGQNPTGTSGSYQQYEAYVVDSALDIELDVLAYASQSHIGPFGDTTPDDLPFGLVTAYCNGYVNCPEWVNGLG
jgi:hypothetical protein